MTQNDFCVFGRLYGVCSRCERPHRESGLVRRTKTNKGRGLKIAEFLRTSFMDGPYGRNITMLLGLVLDFSLGI